MSQHLGRQTILVFNETAGSTGRFETQKTPDVPVAVDNCSVQVFRTEREVRDDTDASIARYELFAPAGAPVTPTSQVRVMSRQVTTQQFTATDGNAYYTTDLLLDVDGEVSTWADRLGRDHHIECYLKERRS